jgi:hypothetical protein
VGADWGQSDAAIAVWEYGQFIEDSVLGVELKAQKIHACQLSALMSGPHDVSAPVRWVGLEFDLSPKDPPREPSADIDTPAPWIWPSR